VLSESLEISGHQFEILDLRREGENWLARFAVDGRPYPPFFEPHVNVLQMNNDEFLTHMKSQALSVVQAVEQGVMA